MLSGPWQVLREKHQLLGSRCRLWGTVSAKRRILRGSSTLYQRSNNILYFVSFVGWKWKRRYRWRRAWISRTLTPCYRVWGTARTLRRVTSAAWAFISSQGRRGQSAGAVQMVQWQKHKWFSCARNLDGVERSWLFYLFTVHIHTLFEQNSLTLINRELWGFFCEICWCKDAPEPWNMMLDDSSVATESS